MRHTILAGTTALVLLMGSGVNIAQAALSQNQINEIESTCVAKHGPGWFSNGLGKSTDEIKQTINQQLPKKYLISISKEKLNWWDAYYGTSTDEIRIAQLVNAFNDCKTKAHEDWFHIEQMEEFHNLSDNRKMDFYDWLYYAFQNIGTNKAKFDSFSNSILHPATDLLHTYTPYGAAFDVLGGTAQMVQKVTDEGVVKIAVFYDGALLLIENLIIKKAKPAIDKMEAKAEAVIKKFKLDQLSPDKFLSKSFCLGFQCADYADLKKIKRDNGITSSKGTIAVARTNIPGLEGQLIFGMSPKIRSNTVPPLSTVGQSTPDYINEFSGIHVRTDLKHMEGDGPHAESWILSTIAKHIENLPVGKIKLIGKKISLLVANDTGVCEKCLAQLPPISKLTKNRPAYMGIFKKFTNKYPQIMIKVEAVKSNVNLFLPNSPRIRPFKYYKHIRGTKKFFVTGFRGWGFYKKK